MSEQEGAPAVPDSKAAANHRVIGKWHGQIKKAPTIHATPL
jgi:hypothetical protein